jgi:hypothetical protein
MKFKEYKLFYHNRWTEFLYYPTEYPIKYELENDKIIIIPILSSNSIGSNNSCTFSIPTLYSFRSHDKELINNIEMPTKFLITIQTKLIVNNESVIKEYPIDIMDKKACIYYLFKD